MCGIVGILTNQTPCRESLTHTVAAMANTVAHRGPDDAGVWVDEKQGIALGHRRLAILDLSRAGNQPISNEAGRVWTVFNGEIYNFPTLKLELEALGHVFRSKTDGEVIVHAYEEYGDSFVQRLDGMFALALWDQDRERLILARDRPGKKPLYYYSGESDFLFGSEIKAIFACPAVSREMDIHAIPLYFTYGYVPCPGTFYNRVSQVPPGSYLTVEGGQVRGPFRYWKLAYPPAGQEPKISEADACRNIRKLLIDAVERRLLSDVPLGAFLSGGIDSSIVVGLMSQLIGRRVKTFSIGFTGDSAFDETPFSRLVASHFHTNHTEFIVEPKGFDLVDLLLSHHDQPYGDSSAIPTYLLCRLAKDHVTVALSGDGGDEVFAGYQRFSRALLTDWLPKPAFALGQTLIEALPQSLRTRRAISRAHDFLLQAAQPLNERYLAWCSFFPREFLAELLTDDIPAELGDSFDACLKQTEGQPLLHRILALNFNTYLPDDLLVKMDRMSMAHALEIRSPFLDTQLVEYAALLHPQFKIHGSKLKYILKKAFADLLPQKILNRGKQGFAIPLDAWFRGDLKDLVQDLLLGETARYRRYLRHESVRRIYQEHQNRVRDHGSELWTLMNFEVWLRSSQAAGV